MSCDDVKFSKRQPLARLSPKPYVAAAGIGNSGSQRLQGDVRELRPCPLRCCPCWQLGLSLEARQSQAQQWFGEGTQSFAEEGMTCFLSQVGQIDGISCEQFENACWEPVFEAQESSGVPCEQKRRKDRCNT